MRQVQRDILRVLISQDGPISSEDVASRLGISSRTVKRAIKELPAAEGFREWEVESGPLGYLLVVGSSGRRVLERALAVEADDDVALD